MSTTSSHQNPSSAHGTRRNLSSTASGAGHRGGASTRAAVAAYKLVIWASVGFVVLALLNTAMGR